MLKKKVGQEKLTSGLKFWGETGKVGQTEMQKRASKDRDAWDTFREEQKRKKYEALYGQTKKG